MNLSRECDVDVGANKHQLGTPNSIVIWALLLIMGCSRSETQAEHHPTSAATNGLNNESDQSHTAPLVSFESSTFDFGKCVEGTPLECQFRFNVLPGKSCTLSEPKTSCGCSVASVLDNDQPYSYGSVLDSGAPKYVNVRLTTTGIRGEKVATVEVNVFESGAGSTSKSTKQVVKLSVRAEVESFAEFTNNDNIVNFGEFSNLEPQTRNIEIASTKSEPFEITGFEPAFSDIQISAKPVTLEKGHWRIEVQIPAGIQRGQVSRLVYINTKNPGVRLFFYIRGRACEGVSISPPNGTLLGAISADKKTYTDITFTPLKPNKDVRILDCIVRQVKNGARDDLSALGLVTATIEDNASLGKATAKIAIMPGAPRGPLFALLDIRVSTERGEVKFSHMISAIIK